jgi:hypothetical protein
MLAQSFLEQGLRHLIMTQSRGVDPEICGLTVKLSPQRQKIIELLARVFGLQERPLTAPACSFKENVGAGIQPGNDADFFQSLAIGLTNYQSSSGGENDTADSHQVLERALFDIAKVLFPFSQEDFRNAATLVLRHKFVGIHEAMTGQSGESSANRRFPAAHESNEDQIG